MIEDGPRLAEDSIRLESYYILREHGEPKAAPLSLDGENAIDGGGVAGVTYFRYFDEENNTKEFVLPSASASRLEGVRFTMKDILSRIPGLEQTYGRTL